ncbi:hypothetical protein J422_04138 [Methanocaldococcus villosus KIN24-T80]|uniref:UPF0216 protein J422_04138 n=1 Tax=Methanocaldococcus villosus KIN24-T80 TaxID=1069083 RepID=N6VQG9_9EURY|nr:hypothetical protein J422_04138 [Methanocaldococcus villosus KIN24-T80]
MEKIIKSVIKDLNPRFKKKSLKELLNEDRPYILVNGKRHRIKRRELELLKEIASEDLKLPIVLEVDPSINAIVVKGKEEVKVVAKILGKEINIFSEENILYIYKPELRIVRRELPTATQLIFKLPLD